MNTIDVTITSYFDQPGLVAELWCDLGMLAAIRYNPECRSFTLQLFAVPGEHPTAVDLESFQSAIKNAQRRILEIEGLSPSQARTK